MMKYYVLFILTVISACQNPENDNQVPGTYNQSLQNRGYGKGQQHRHRGGHRSTERTNIYTSGDTVHVPAGSPVYAKLKMQTVTSGEFNGQCYTTGVVKPVSGHIAEITAPFEGRIVKSFVALGQKVNNGTPLFEVSSSDYIESMRLFLQAKRERELAEINFKRKKDLLDSGISSRKEFDESRLEFDLADKEYEKTAEILKIYNLNPDETDLSRPLIVRSPISGEIVRNDITVGQYINADSDPVITVADLDRIWIIANAREKDLGIISLNDNVGIITESFPDKSIAGTVNYIGNMMNEQTRSVEVYVECDNKSRTLKPGMFVTVCFSHKLNNALVIPAGSVMQDQDRSYLFVQVDPGVYVKRTVSLSSAEGNNLVILSGLETGSTIVSEGGIYLQ